MYYTFDWMDGKALLAAIDPWVDYDIHRLHPDEEPTLEVNGLVVDGVDILKSPSPTVKALALEIKHAIENDWDWIGEAFSRHGYRLKGEGPSQQWRVA